MRNNRVFWAIVLILVGVLMLSRQWGLIALSIRYLGPLFLIILGAWVLWGVTQARSAPAAERVAIPLGTAERARVSVHHGAGRLQIDASAGAEHLLEGTFVGGLEHREQQEADTLDVTLRSPQDSRAYVYSPWSWTGARGLDWTLGLNGDTPLALDLHTGANEARLDLADLRVTNLHLDTGASSTRIILPAHAGMTRVDIKAGAASLVIRVPSGVAARISAQGGLSGISVDTGRFPRLGSGYCSPDYDSAVNKVDISVEMGVGSVDVR